jgi:hypothetical protein
MKDLDSIYVAARELPSAQRPAYLAQACAGDPVLRRRVEQMLAVAEKAEAFIADLPEDEPPGCKAASPPAKTMKLEITDV